VRSKRPPRSAALLRRRRWRRSLRSWLQALCQLSWPRKTKSIQYLRMVLYFWAAGASARSPHQVPHSRTPATPRPKARHSTGWQPTARQPAQTQRPTRLRPCHSPARQPTRARRPTGAGRPTRLRPRHSQAQGRRPTRVRQQVARTVRAARRLGRAVPRRRCPSRSRRGWPVGSAGSADLGLPRPLRPPVEPTRNHTRSTGPRRTTRAVPSPAANITDCARHRRAHPALILQLCTDQNGSDPGVKASTTARSTPGWSARGVSRETGDRRPGVAGGLSMGGCFAARLSPPCSLPCSPPPWLVRSRGAVLTSVRRPAPPRQRPHLRPARALAPAERRA